MGSLKHTQGIDCRMIHMRKTCPLWRLVCSWKLRHILIGFDLKYKGDVWGDFISEEVDYDTREAWMFMRPTDYMDIKFGRQVLTWGTGDWVFLNDLFPKDWQFISYRAGFRVS